MTKPTETGRRAAGRAVLARRGELGLTQREVAQRAGVDLKTIWGLEKGARWPIARNLSAIARTLGLDAAGLACIADSETAADGELAEAS